MPEVACSSYPDCMRSGFGFGAESLRAGSQRKAFAAFQNAHLLAEDDYQRAAALSAYAEHLYQDGRVLEASQLMRAALQIHPAPTDSMTARTALYYDVLQEMPMTRTDLRCSLERGVRQFQSGNPAGPRVVGEALESVFSHYLELPNVHFRFDSVQPDSLTASNLQVLAEELCDARFKQSRVTLIGHADSRGTADYNQTLSRMRADAVLGELESRNESCLLIDFRTVGRGEAELLNTGSSEWAHRENRRLEIVIEQG